MLHFDAIMNYNYGGHGVDWLLMAGAWLVMGAIGRIYQKMSE